MSFDIAISENGDFIFAASRDLGGVSGTDLIEQRMKLRLQMIRGAWVYDDSDSLGSNLGSLIGMSAADAHTALGAYVREALRPMNDEISIDDVDHLHIDSQGNLTDAHDPATRGIVIIVKYTLIAEPDSGIGTEEQQLQISVPVITGGGE